MKRLNTKGFGTVEILLVLVVLVLVAGGGAYLYHKNHETKPVSSSTTNSTTSQTSKTSTSDKTATTTDPYAGWKTYTSTQEKATFKYPSDWTTKTVGAADPAGDGLQLTSPSGMVLTFDSSVQGLGGGCADTDPHVIIYKVLPKPHVSGFSIVEAGTAGSADEIGLVSGQPPALGDTGSCLYYMTFKTKHDPSAKGWFIGGPDTKITSADLSTAEQILESYTY